VGRINQSSVEVACQNNRRHQTDCWGGTEGQGRVYFCLK
jgi:hypothetical protein